MRLRIYASAALLAGVVSIALGDARPPAGASFGPSWIDGPTSRGETIPVRCPPDDLFTNIGSKIDGAGMCVDTSVETQARFLGLDQYRGFRDYFAAVEGGGNYPAGVDRQLRLWCQRKSLPAPRYVQYTGPDPSPILELCERTGRGCAIAYGYSPRYGQAINHMVFCPHPGVTGKGYAAIADNNVFGGLTRAEGKRFEWMARGGENGDELVRRMKTQADQWGRAVAGEAWVFCWLEPPPPPEATVPPSPSQFPQ